MVAVDRACTAAPCPLATGEVGADLVSVQFSSVGMFNRRSHYQWRRTRHFVVIENDVLVTLLGQGERRLALNSWSCVSRYNQRRNGAIGRRGARPAKGAAPPLLAAAKVPAELDR